MEMRRRGNKRKLIGVHGGYQEGVKNDEHGEGKVMNEKNTRLCDNIGRWG